MVPYPKGLKGVFNLNDLLNIVGNGGNDLIDEMHHTVGCMVVSFQQPGTVHCDNLSGEEARVSNTRGSRKGKLQEGQTMGPQLGAEWERGGSVEKTQEARACHRLSHRRTEP